MKKKGLLVWFLLAVFLSGCRLYSLDIDELIQTDQVCAMTPFTGTIQSTLHVWEEENPIEFPGQPEGEFTVIQEGVSSAVLLPEGWNVLSCRISGGAEGFCLPDETVAESADLWAGVMGIYNYYYGVGTIPPGMKWHGFSWLLDSDLTDGVKYTFTFTIQAATVGSFKLLYFTGAGGIYTDESETGRSWAPEGFPTSMDGTSKSYAARLIDSKLCPIPTLSPWGTAILFVLFLGAGVFMVRKRNKSAARAARA